DTNFLFGILDLHVHPQVEVSTELLKAIKKHHLPFVLQYHSATEREMLSTIDHYAATLKERRWNQSLSRAALTSPFVSGIELKYHQLNAEKKIDPDVFLQPFE